MKKYLHERVADRVSVCIGRGGGSSVMAISLGYILGKNEVSQTINQRLGHVIRHKNQEYVQWSELSERRMQHDKMGG